MRQMSRARAFIVIDQYMLNFPLPLRVKHVTTYLEREKQINCNTIRNSSNHFLIAGLNITQPLTRPYLYNLSAFLIFVS